MLRVYATRRNIAEGHRPRIRQHEIPGPRKIGNSERAPPLCNSEGHRHSFTYSRSRPGSNFCGQAVLAVTTPLLTVTPNVKQSEVRKT